jgi:hypothetical protein
MQSLEYSGVVVLSFICELSVIPTLFQSHLMVYCYISHFTKIEFE